MMKDLFGENISEEVDDFKEYLKQNDSETLNDRVERLKYLNKIKSDGYLMTSGDLELGYTYQEVQFAFVQGYFISTLVLNQAYIEKLLQSYFIQNNIKCRNTFDAMLKYARDNELFNEYIIRKLDFIRLIRNPITHLKSQEYLHTLDKRASNEKKHPWHKLEEDARLAISIMIHVTQKGFK
ncbi:MAG: hypothetical protein K9G38_04775 [Bacteroidales bacterium]|nr:hypothetical protein [Bacteroidales bacterium]